MRQTSGTGGTGGTAVT
eukprot:gene27074-biopygen17632